MGAVGGRALWAGGVGGRAAPLEAEFGNPGLVFGNPGLIFANPGLVFVIPGLVLKIPGGRTLGAGGIGGRAAPVAALGRGGTPLAPRSYQVLITSHPHLTQYINRMV